MKNWKKMGLFLSGLMLLAGCMSLSPAKHAYDRAIAAAEQGNPAAFLKYMTEAALIDKEAVPIYKALAQDGPSSVRQFEVYFESSSAESSPEALNKRYDTIKDMVGFYENLRMTGLPLSDPKQKYVFTTEVKDYSSDLETARVAAYRAYYGRGKNELARRNIKEASKAFNTAVHKFRNETEKNIAINDISGLYVQFCESNMNSGDIAMRLLSYDALQALRAFNPVAPEINRLDTAIKTSIAEYYYQRATQLERSVSQADAKKAMSLYDEAMKWVPNYKDSKIRKNKIVILIEVRRLNEIFAKFDKKVHRVDRLFSERLYIRNRPAAFQCYYTNIRDYNKIKDHLEKSRKAWDSVGTASVFREESFQISSQMGKWLTTTAKALPSGKKMPDAEPFSALSSNVLDMQNNYESCSNLVYNFKRSILSESGSFKHLQTWVENTEDEVAVNNAKLLITSIADTLAAYDAAFTAIEKNYNSGIKGLERLDRNVGADNIFSRDAEKMDDILRVSLHAKETCDSANAKEFFNKLSSEGLSNSDIRKYYDVKKIAVSTPGNELEQNREKYAKVIQSVDNDMSQVHSLMSNVKASFDVDDVLVYASGSAASDVRSFTALSTALSKLKQQKTPDEIISEIQRLDRFTK